MLSKMDTRQREIISVQRCSLKDKWYINDMTIVEINAHGIKIEENEIERAFIFLKDKSPSILHPQNGKI